MPIINTNGMNKFLFASILSRVKSNFQEIKKHMKNLLFKDMDELIDKLCDVLKNLSPEKLKKLTLYPYIKEDLLG